MIAALLLLLSAPPAGEDAAHRADRLETERLNRAAAAVVDRRRDRNRDAAAGYARDRAAYERAMADWRRRVAACRAGEVDRC